MQFNPLDNSKYAPRMQWSEREKNRKKERKKCVKIKWAMDHDGSSCCRTTRYSTIVSPVSKQLGVE